MNRVCEALKVRNRSCSCDWCMRSFLSVGCSIDRARALSSGSRCARGSDATIVADDGDGVRGGKKVGCVGTRGGAPYAIDATFLRAGVLEDASVEGEGIGRGCEIVIAWSAVMARGCRLGRSRWTVEGGGGGGTSGITTAVLFLRRKVEKRRKPFLNLM